MRGIIYFSDGIIYFDIKTIYQQIGLYWGGGYRKRHYSFHIKVIGFNF